MYRLILIQTILTFSLVLIGCASQPAPVCDAECEAQLRRDAFVASQPDLAPRTREAILKGRVLLGMSRDEVIASIGEPAQTVDVNASWAAREQWVYRAANEATSLYFFKFGRVTSWANPIHN